MTVCPIKAKENNLQPSIEKSVSLKGVEKAYPYFKAVAGKPEEFYALKDISLDVNKGEILGIIGRNGAGKTTLLSIIAGVISPGCGQVAVSGKVMGLFNLGVGFQDELTGKENIFLNGTILGALRKDVQEKFDKIAEFSELGDFINMPLGSYSQGMRLRLGFSIIANLDFDVLVIDEILTVGDALFQSKCYQKLMEFRRAGKTLILTSQNTDLMERFCDRIILLDHGKLLFQGNPGDCINVYRGVLNSEKFFVGSERKHACVFENTKKWAEDKVHWGKTFGTKEVVIDKVVLLNRFGRQCERIRSREPLKIKVHFTVKNIVKEPHFGIALFRGDGVYCYGPNTALDGYHIQELQCAKGYFTLEYDELLLAPGEYYISAAIWDKSEAVAFDYHCGCYKLAVTGYANHSNELLNIPYSVSPKRLRDMFSFFPGGCLRLSNEPDKSRKDAAGESVKLDSIKLVDIFDCEKEVFTTAQSVRLLAKFGEQKSNNKNNMLWIGLFRDDGVYCKGITYPFISRNTFSIFFPKLLLLPGKYKIAVGIQDKLTTKIIITHPCAYRFQTVFDKEDHGTVYLEHNWSWRIK